jgi:protein-S-isoprenylcysteine O-methyltransferase Ste14
MTSSLVFTSNNALIGFVIVFICFFVAEQIGGVIIPAKRRGGARVKRSHVLSNIIIYFSWPVILFLIFIFAAIDIVPLPDWAYYIGLAVMITGIVFRQWAIAVLGRYFSRAIGVQKEHKIVESGPYHLIRHPSYAGVLIFWVGMGLAVQSISAVLIALAVFCLVYGYRIYVEEKVLINELGDSYVEYMKRTKRVIPYII